MVKLTAFSSKTLLFARMLKKKPHTFYPFFCMEIVVTGIISFVPKWLRSCRRKLGFYELFLDICHIMFMQNKCPPLNFFDRCSGLFEGALILHLN